MNIQEGYMPYLGYQTYYRIAGNLHSGRTPLVLLHGGPGSTHNYFETLDALAEETPLIMYDQLGCGNSWVEGHPELWIAETWVHELEALREHLDLPEIHLLGQSWGGMLLLDYVCNYHPEGVKSLILSSTLPSSWMWGIEQHRMIKELPEEMQAAIDDAVSRNDYSGAAYQAAEDEFMFRHAAGDVSELGFECLTRPKRTGREAYVTAWGPNEFTPTGTLKDFDVTTQLADIKQPTLIINGGNDLCTPYIAKYMYDRIPNSRWELFRNCRHCCFAEANEEYVRLMREWLTQNA